MKRRSFVSSLVLFVFLALFTTGALAAETGAVTASGTCGANLTWSLDSAGTLTISGTGSMEDYYPSNSPAANVPAPWYDQRDNVKLLVVSPGVTSIGSFAFSDCKNLVGTTIADSVASIGRSAFANCSSLMRVTLPNRLQAIGEGVFKGCTSLVTVAIPDSVTSIGISSFDSCNSLESVTLPNRVTDIGDSAFSGCASLKDINIPDSISYIGYKAFRNCRSLTKIVIPTGVNCIAGLLFSGCRKLVYVDLPQGITSIGKGAFEGCRSLTAITIPSGVESIGDSAFDNCESLVSIDIPSSVVSISGSNFCYMLTTVSITSIPAWCNISFEYDTSNPLYYAKSLYLNGVKLETLEIPSGVQVIKEHAFVNAECLKAVSIPKSVIGIAAGAFAGCSNIERVYYAGSKADWESLPISAGNDALMEADIYYNATPSDYYCTVTCAVSPGGTVTVDKNTYAPGETVTVSAKPFTGYRLDTILVDGTAIPGNTFPAAKNHTVSAVFEKLPTYGGDETFRIGDISVCTASGEALAAIPKGESLATIPVTNLSAPGGITVMIACYTAAGQYQGMTFVSFEDVPTGATLKVTTPISNSGGTIAGIKAFIVKSPFDITPVGNAVVFGL